MSPLATALKAVEEAVYTENERGGEARAVVARMAGLLGVDLCQDVVGDDPFDIWSSRNMHRVVNALSELLASNNPGAKVAA